MPKLFLPLPRTEVPRRALKSNLPQIKMVPLVKNPPNTIEPCGEIVIDVEPVDVVPVKSPGELQRLSWREIYSREDLYIMLGLFLLGVACGMLLQRLLSH